MKTLVLSVLIAGVFVLAGCGTHETPNGVTELTATDVHSGNEAGKLVAELACETTTVRSEATVWFTWQIRNTGDLPVHLLNHFAYASRGPLLSLQFTGPEQKVVTVGFDLRDCDVTWGLQETKIRTLGPNESFNLKARADLKAFGSLAPGQYTVLALYEPLFWVRDMMTDDIQKKYGLRPDDIWQNEVKSNVMRLTINK
jgi:hypothetical protein